MSDDSLRTSGGEPRKPSGSLDNDSLRTSGGEPLISGGSMSDDSLRTSGGEPRKPSGSLDNTLAGREQMARLWSGWRIPYILANDDERSQGLDKNLTLFEGIEQSGLEDSVTYILWRGEHCFALLNAYPYTSGHLMVLPKKAAVSIEDLDAATFQELWEGVRMAIIAVKAEYQPEGVNMGMNLGRASGAGVPDHMHVHVLPRWSGDTNFLTSIAEARTLPESLADSWARLKGAWPSS